MPRTPEWQQGYNIATKYWQTRYNLLKLQTTRAENVRAAAQTERDTLAAELEVLQAEYDQYRIDHP
jgi:hypothetical protein